MPGYWNAHSDLDWYGGAGREPDEEEIEMVAEVDWPPICKRLAHREMGELYARWTKHIHRRLAMTALIEALAQLAVDDGFDRHNIIDAMNAALDKIEGSE